MSGLIGGSGSTGSSLLRQMLNRHSTIFSGPETSLFCKADLYNHWQKSKRNILKRGYWGLKNHSWHIYRGVDIVKQEIGLKDFQIAKMIDDSSNFNDFINSFYSYILKQKRKTFWLEKTPSNAFSFHYFAENIDGVLIHLYRNPYDTIASLYKRGFSHFQAVVIYLLNTSFALSQNYRKCYYSLSYENLVNEPKETLEKLCKFLNLSYEENMISTFSLNYSDDPSKIKSWQYDESQEVGIQSIGKFDSLEKEDREIILYFCNHIRINNQEIEKHNLQHNSIKDLCMALNYEYINHDYSGLFIELLYQKWCDLIRRSYKASYYHIFNNPIKIFR